MDKSRPELEKQPDNKYKWNPRVGERYFLGYHHGRVAGILTLGTEETHAFYAGGIEGKFVFFSKKGDKLRRYTASSTANTIWYSDGEDEPSFSAIDARFDREIEEGATKDFIMNQTNRWEQSSKPLAA